MRTSSRAAPTKARLQLQRRRLDRREDVRFSLLGRLQRLPHPRIRGSANYITDAIQKFKDHPGLRYISDGDPTTVSAPKNLDPALGTLSADLGRPVVRY